MTERDINEPFFSIKRLSPEDATRLIATRLKKARLSSTKSYNITSDDQRYELVRRVLDKELSLKEVRFRTL